MKHFLKETDFEAKQLREIFALAQSFKRYRNRQTTPALQGQSWALLFFKSSTRTRVSFEVGIHELGGNALYLSTETTQISRGETVGDTARNLSRYLHGVIIRTYQQSMIEEFADEGSIPVVNALTDFLHPCQSYSDLFSMAERWSHGGDLIESLKGRKIAYIGDCNNNMANSLVLAANLFDMKVSLSGPQAYAPAAEFDSFLASEGFSGGYEFSTHTGDALDHADVVYTDVWVSMGDEGEESERIQQLQPYTVSMELLRQAKPDALFMHCLPAHPGMEVTREVLDCPQSIVFDQAENRLHMQKAILAVLAETNR